MSSLHTLISDLSAKQIKLSLHNGSLQVRAPKNALDDALRNRLKEHKPALLSLLKQEAQNRGWSRMAIEPVSHDDHLPLSYTQQRMWFLDQLTGNDDAAYTMPFVADVRGPLDRERFEKAFTALTKRHDLLRTRFEVHEKQPRQRIEKDMPAALKWQTADEASVKQSIMRSMELPFDLQDAPQYRATVFEVAKDRHILCINLHHIISDGWSTGVLIRDLMVFYEAGEEAANQQLPPLPIQFADYAHWEQSVMTGNLLDAQLAYWKEQLDGAPALLELPTDHARPVVQAHRGAVVPFSLNQEQTDALQVFCRETQSTPFMVTLTAFAVLLYRYSGQRDFVIGSVSANRERPELMDLIGPFFNELALRFNMHSEEPFSDLLQRTRKTCLEAFQNQYVSFDRVVEAVKPRRDMSFSPVFQVLFTMMTAEDPGTLKGDLTVEAVDLTTQTSQFDLNFQLRSRGGTIEGTMTFDTDLFREETIRTFLSHYAVILDALLTKPSTRIGDLPILTATDQENVLVTWNQTGQPFPPERCIHQVFEQLVVEQPHAPAMVQAGQIVDYETLNHRAGQVAAWLKENGVSPGDIVATALSRSPAMGIGILGILKAGAAYMPMDPNYPKERLAFMLKDVGASIILTERAICAALPENTAKQCFIEDVPTETAPLSLAVSPDSLAYVIFTSGSTGKPKGILIRHRGALNNIMDLNTRFEIGPGDRVLGLSSQSFDMCVYETLGMFTCGGCLVLPDADRVKESAHWTELILQHQVTVWNSAPALLEMFIQQATNLPGPKPESLRLAFLGGDWVPVSAPSRFRKIVGDAQVVVMGGATESSIHSTITEVDTVDPSWQSIPYGRPMANQQTYVLDDRALPVPIGVTGELHLAGIGLALGYTRRPGLTAEKFIPNAFSKDPGSRLYRTGDLVKHRTDGQTILLGRRDHQVKIRGLRIECGEIQAALQNLPGIKRAVVTARDNPQGHRYLAAYLLLEPMQASQEEQWRKELSKQLPEFMVPSVYKILDALPLSPNGKVDRRALPDPFSEMDTRPEEIREPRTDMERVLALIWADLLQHQAVGIENNFFDLGGHSLIANQLMIEIREIFQIQVPLSGLFIHPTIQSFSEYLLTQGESSDLEQIAALYLELEDMPDEEIEARLASESHS